MAFNIGNLYFSPNPVVFTLGLAALFAIGWLCVMAWRRAVRKKRTGALELLRFLCATIVFFMLCEPEWRTILHPKTPPEVLVLYDDSHSTTTEDAAVPAADVGTGPAVITRADQIKRILNKSDIWNGIAETNKVTIQPYASVPENTDPGLSGSDLFTPLNDALQNFTNLRSIILLSDGDANIGKPPVVAAQKLLLRKIPLYTIPIGSESRLPDLDLLSVTAPTYGIVGENVQVPFTVRSSLDRDIRTVARLRDGSGREETKNITIPANTEFTSSLLWRLTEKGSSTLTLSIPVANGELIERNNSEKFAIAGRQESIKVLVIETTPRWEYRFIRNALSRDPGVDVDCLLLHPQLGTGGGPDYIDTFPEELEDLQKYDVVFIGDIGIGPDQLTEKQAKLLRGLVENQASGLVFIPGSRGNAMSLIESPLGDLLPVQLDPAQANGISDSIEAPLTLTGDGQKSLLTMLGDTEDQNPLIWRSLPGFFWHAPVIKSLGGATVLATHANRRNEYGKIPLIVTKAAGNGKVLFMGIDSAWRWRRGVEDLYHYRFWGQVARWMSYQRNIAAGERVRLYFTPERPNPGDTVSLTANAFDENGAPQQTGKVVVDIIAPDGIGQRLELESDSATWGTFSGIFKTLMPGEYTLKAFPKGYEQSAIEAKMIAQGTELEKIGQPSRPAVLEEMSRVAKGRTLAVNELNSLLNEIRSLPEPTPLFDRLELWSHWITATVLISLLSLFWLLRKLNGTF